MATRIALFGLVVTATYIVYNKGYIQGYEARKKETHWFDQNYPFMVRWCVNQGCDVPGWWRGDYGRA